MNGAVAAGHPLTAEAGARVLAGGGNAVDACIAAVVASWVTESPLTGPGGGGFMLVHRARDRADRLLDFFVTVPGRSLPRGTRGTVAAVDVAFAAEGIETYQVGPGSCAVPGTVAGLGEAHRAFGRLPWPELIAPGLELARAGVVLTWSQATLHGILDPVLRSEDEARRIYGEAAPRTAGDRLVMHGLADALEVIARDGAGAFYRGELGRHLSDHVRARGGLLTPEDLAEYRVIRRTPVRTGFSNHEFVSNPPPSSGGVLIAFALRLLDRIGVPQGSPASADGISRLAEVMREATRARGGRFATELHRGGLVARLLGDDTVDEAVGRMRAALRVPAHEPATSRSTTHVSVVDAVGNAASCTCSTGAGSGVVVPGTGVHMNNMLGEEDLNVGARAAAPGRRLTSMMAPSLVLRDGAPRLVVGSAGSARLRGAVLQNVVNAVHHRMPLDEAIAAPRVHLDRNRLHLEPGYDEAIVDELERRGYDIVCWREQNIYFGGASVVALGEDGRLEAAGDPRRGGAGVVVA